MKKRKQWACLLLGLILLFGLCSCLPTVDNKSVSFPSKSQEKAESSFSITFIDVGEGDSALIECDGHYMLIDGGNTNYGETVYKVLEDNCVTQLDYLVVSHWDKDHFGGLINVLSHDALTVKRILSNSPESDKDPFQRFYDEVLKRKLSISVPKVHDPYKLGNAEIEALQVSARNENDSLVLLVTYGKQRFLFTGDIEGKAQQELRVTLSEDRRAQNNEFKIDLFKLPHHGAFNDNHGYSNSSLNSLFTLTNPDFAVISVGANNQYNHPHPETEKLLEDYGMNNYEKGKVETKAILRTDMNGNLIIHSDGERITVETEK